MGNFLRAMDRTIGYPSCDFGGIPHRGGQTFRRALPAAWAMDCKTLQETCSRRGGFRRNH